MKRQVACTVAMLAALPLMGCSSFEQRVVAVENRQAAIEQQLADLQSALGETQSQLRRVQADIDSALDPLRTQNADRGEDLRAMRREVTALEQQIADFEIRIERIAEAAASTPAAGPGVGAAMPPARGQRSVDPGTRAQPVDDAATELYNSAYGDYLDERYELCVQGFEEYLRRYPTSASADNSLYWAGMCQRQLGRTQDARDAFQRVVADFPDSEVAADAVFMDARILVELGRTDDAIESFRRLIQAYPDRDAAFLACGQITDLGGEPPDSCQQ